MTEQEKAVHRLIYEYKYNPKNRIGKMGLIILVGVTSFFIVELLTGE